MYASQTWTKDLIGKTLKSAQDKGLLGTDEITISSTEPTGDDKPKFWLDPESASANTNNTVLTSGFAYDTAEQIVGCWTNGKPIYRKVITDTFTSSDYSFDVSSLSIDRMLSTTGHALVDNDINYITIPCNYSAYAYMSCYYNISNKLLHVLSGSQYTKITAYLTVEYTKTTDAENSFKASMLGASAIDIPEAKGTEYPDYANRTQIITSPSVTGQTMTQNGWIQIWAGTDGTTNTDSVNIMIDGVTVMYYVSSQAYERQMLFLPISKDDVISISKDSNFCGWYNIYFIPCK